MSFTPRFGEITNYDEVITETVCNNLKDEMELDKITLLIDMNILKPNV